MIHILTFHFTLDIDKLNTKSIVYNIKHTVIIVKLHPKCTYRQYTIQRQKRSSGLRI